MTWEIVRHERDLPARVVAIATGVLADVQREHYVTCRKLPLTDRAGMEIAVRVNHALFAAGVEDYRVQIVPEHPARVLLAHFMVRVDAPTEAR